MQRQPLSLSLLIIGDYGVGKTSLLVRFCDGKFEPAAPSVGIDAKEKDVMVGDDSVNLLIKDTAGQERFAGITCSNFRGVSGILLAFDITERKSFESVQNSWIKEVTRYAGEKVRLCLVATKADLAEDRKVDAAEAKAFADSVNMEYFETSAKDDVNVEAAFTSVASGVLASRRESENVGAGTKGSSTLDLTMEPAGKKKRCEL